MGNRFWTHEGLCSHACVFFFFFLEFLLSFTESWRLESLLSSHSCSCPGSAWTFPGLRTQPFLFTIGSGILFDAFHYSFSLSHTFCFHSLTVVMNPSPLINMEGKLTCNSQANMLNAPRENPFCESVKKEFTEILALKWEQRVECISQ